MIPEPTIVEFGLAGFRLRITIRQINKKNNSNQSTSIKETHSFKN